MMAWFIGMVRLLLAMGSLGVGTVLIVGTSWLPLRIRGIRLGGWLAMALAWWLARLFRVRLRCDEQARLRSHVGLIFPNHLSFLDIILLISIWPVRFVSMKEVRRWPFVGQIAAAIDTVFVDRGDRASRQATRQLLAGQAAYYPAIVLFPEGKISVKGTLQPFRYGAFEVAIQGELSFLPCVIGYKPLSVVGWTDEPLLTALWRMARFTGPIHATLHVLPAVRPRLGDDPQRLAEETYAAMLAVQNDAGQAVR